MSAKIVMENSSEFLKKGPDARVIIEGLISAGVACIAGSRSVPVPNTFFRMP